MRSAIYRDDAVPNQDRTFGEIGPDEVYLFAEYIDGDAKVPLLFTELEIQVAISRARRNPEDVEVAQHRASRRRSAITMATWFCLLLVGALVGLAIGFGL